MEPEHRYLSTSSHQAMYGYPRGSKPQKNEPKEPEQPRDALSALMDGETPDDKALRFPNEQSTKEWRAQPSTRPDIRPSRRHNGMEDYDGDHHFNSKPNQSMGEFQPAKQNSTFDSVKSGAAKSGTYVKDKTVAGAHYMKEKDWSKEKEYAGKAGVATKNGAIYAGRGMAKGAGWLWNSGKNGIESMKSKK